MVKGRKQNWTTFIAEEIDSSSQNMVNHSYPEEDDRNLPHERSVPWNHKLPTVPMDVDNVRDGN